MKIIITSILFLSTIIGICFGQNSSVISGQILNINQKPIENASIYLVTNPGRAVIKTSITNENGEYKIIDFPNGEFLIEATAIGYVKGISEVFTTSAKSIIVKTILLEEANTKIDEVTVVGQLPQIQSKNGKLTMNIENSSIAAGNNALEILKRAPGVNVDKDNNISLMGQQGVNVTIDGRQTYLTGEQLASLLMSTDGSQIKSIELSTTRSARDDAEGSAGIINIVMKKNRLEGLNGTFVASAGMGEKFRGNTSFNLNYKKNASTFFSNISYSNDKMLEDLRIERIIPNNNDNTFFNQIGDFQKHNKRLSYKVGLEQKTSERNIITIQANGGNNRDDMLNPGTTYMSKVSSSIDSIMYSDNGSRGHFNRYSFNVNNEFKIDSAGKKLTADLDYSLFKTDDKLNFAYYTYFPDNTLMYNPEFEKSDLDVLIKILATKVDYTQSLWNGVIETGLKFSQVNSENDVLFTDSIGSSWVKDPSRSNTFHYKESIGAGYFDYSTSIKRWSLKVGIRAEYTMSDGLSVTQNKQVKRDYLDLFPSGSISYNLSPNHIFSINYSRKVARPNYKNLNPFEYYVDKRTYNKGNPYLNPEYTDGFGLNYTLFQRYNIAVGHDITKHAIVESIGQDTVLKTSWIISENLGEKSLSYLNLTIPMRIGKIWSVFNNITGVYMHFKGPISSTFVDQGSAFVQANMNNNFRINKALSSELSVRYRSNLVYNMYNVQGRYNIDLGCTYNLKDQRSSLKLAATDIFRTERNDVFTDFNQFNAKIFQYQDARTIRLTFNYKFGNLKQVVRRKDNSSEEKDRAL